MIKLKELIKDEIISKIMNEDQDADGTIEGGYDDGDTWKSPSGQYGGKYKGQIHSNLDPFYAAPVHIDNSTRWRH